MRKKGFKGRCEKRVLSKCREVCRTYDPLQAAYADLLQADERICEIRCNVPLDDDEHITDFLCVKTDGELIVRECVQRKHWLSNTYRTTQLKSAIFLPDQQRRYAWQ